jgi:hypothetical protein
MVMQEMLHGDAQQNTISTIFGWKFGIVPTVRYCYRFRFITDVNLFERRTLFTSSTDSIQLRYDNTYYGSTGSFWISAQGIW